MSEIINTNLAKVCTEEAHRSRQTVLVWLSGWKSHNSGLAMDVSSASWAWLRVRDHRLSSLSPAVLLYFRFHKHQEVRGSGKQDKERKKTGGELEGRLKPSERIWFDFRASVPPEVRPTGALPAPSHLLTRPWQGFLAATRRPRRRCAALASVSSCEGRWQATVNLLLEPINLADEDLQSAVKAGLVGFPSICDRDIRGVLLSSLKTICSVEMPLTKPAAWAHWDPIVPLWKVPVPGRVPAVGRRGWTRLRPN